MTLDSFSSFYNAIHGYPPFMWQVELLRKVASEGWPGTIDMPTSSGKTSAIDVAVFHLALEAGKNTFERLSSIRMFFVVDRRIVVDEAFDHAEKIALSLRDATEGVVKDVAGRLIQFGGQLPLQVSRMRGGMLRDNGWADEPNQPTVCLSTVDQVGSRLLFRGYQVGERSRSIHAGLIGNDSLLILDEAHLSNAFHETLNAITGKYAKWAEADKAPARTPIAVKMSATTSGDNPFALKEQWVEADAAVLGKRLRAIKLAQLRGTQKRFEDEMAAAAKELAAEIGVGVVGVIANTVGSAREVFSKLTGDKVLLIGRNRPWCSEKLWKLYHERIAARENRERSGLLYVVATQTVEVGANIDFDALVTESAPIDALRQRFGRLNRLGREGDAKAIVVLRPKEDHVYGERTRMTWDFLRPHAPVDFGVLAMNRLLEGVETASLASQATRAPLLFPGHLEWWIQTSPPPKPDPDVAPFLHGPGATEAADVQIVWREDLIRGEEDTWVDLVGLMPPVQREALAMPLGAVRRWLRGQDQEVSDIEGVVEPEEAKVKEDRRERPRAVIFWRSQKAELGNVNQLRPGDTIVVPAADGGADDFGWNPKFSPTVDIADAINKDEADKGLRRRVIRLNSIDTARVQDFRTSGETRGETDLLELLGVPPNGKVDLAGRLIVYPLKNRNKLASIEPATQETDEADESSLTDKRSLTDHTAGVLEHAKKFTAGCGIPSGLADDILLAARMHDWGKCDERFQSWLSGKPFYGGEYLAKSGEVRSRGDNARLRRDAGYPEGARHEAASVNAAAASELLSEANDRELVLHLIGTHHGCGRPLFPVWKEEPGFMISGEGEGKSFEVSSGVELARIDSGWADRFVLLNRRYGYWGLAYLEAILRRADCMQSRKEEQECRKSN